jgi:CxxC motif-containing protein (DUF1111 family)
LKLNTSTLQVQVAAAYNNDIGITSYVFRNETSQGQADQSDGIDDDPELPDSVLNAVVFYTKSLQVPARRDVTIHRSFLESKFLKMQNAPAATILISQLQ